MYERTRTRYTQEHTHQKEHTSKHSRHCRHTLKLPLTWSLYLWPLEGSYPVYEKLTYRTIVNTDITIIHTGIYCCYLLGSCGLGLDLYQWAEQRLDFLLLKSDFTVHDKPLFMADEIRGALKKSALGDLLVVQANSS